jgi:dTDP-4-amino-4,6-dideoxygalactose transaminase
VSYPPRESGGGNAEASRENASREENKYLAQSNHGRVLRSVLAKRVMGKIVKTTVGVAPPVITANDRERVSAALDGVEIAYGKVVNEFEQAVARRLDLGMGVALISGTAALHLALHAVDVRRNDLVLMPTLTFVAPANAARYLGAQPLFFDSEPEYRQLDVDRLVAWLQDECDSDGTRAVHARTGRRIGAIMPVDLLGHPCDVGRLAGTAREMGIPIVEDAAQALGATLRGRTVGAEADVTCLSFNANKIVTSGGGGMLLSKDRTVIIRVRSLANQAKEGGPYYVHNDVGFNYRLPSAQAALGLSQFGRLNECVERKLQLASFYESALADLPGLSMPRCAPSATVNGWLFTIHIDAAEFGCTADQLMKRLKEQHKIEARPIFTPLHACGVYQGLEAEPCPVAEALGATGLSLPSSLSISDEELERVCEGIREEASVA